MAKNKTELMPGTIIQTQSGRCVAFYEHRTDIIANGENEQDAKKNLKKMYAIVIKHEEAKIDAAKQTVKVPKSYPTKRFTEKLHIS